MYAHVPSAVLVLPGLGWMMSLSVLLPVEGAPLGPPSNPLAVIVEVTTATYKHSGSEICFGFFCTASSQSASSRLLPAFWLVQTMTR